MITSSENSTVVNYRHEGMKRCSQKQHSRDGKEKKMKNYVKEKIEETMSFCESDSIL